MKDMLIGLAFMAVWGPLVTLYVAYGTEMNEKLADAVEAFLFPVEPEPKTTGDMIAMFGEAVDA